MGSPPIKLDEVIGKLDHVFSISKPSMHVENFDLMNYNEDERSLYDRLIGVEQDKHEWLVHGSKDIMNYFHDMFEGMLERVSTEEQKVEFPRASAGLPIPAAATPPGSPPSLAPPTHVPAVVVRECFKTFVAMFKNELVLKDVFEPALHVVYALQDAAFEEEAATSKEQVLTLLEEVGKRGVIKGDGKAEIEPLESEILYSATIAELKTLYKSYDNFDKKFKALIESQKVLLGRLESGDYDIDTTHMNDSEIEVAEEEAHDKLSDRCDKAKNRSDQMKLLRDNGLEQIYSLLSDSYPDVSISLHLTKKTDAMHKLELPDDILHGIEDPQKSTQFIDDLLQTCLNWLPNYWSLIPILLRLKSHEDRFSPVPILSIADMKKETNLGELLGSVVESQMAKLWSIVARGNSESLPTMSMTSIGAGESLFEEIKSGGNGVEQRISRVENKNIVSFLQHIIHYHEKNLSDKRRRSKAIMQLAHSDFATGSLNDACDRLLGYWREASYLNVQVDWYSFMHLACTTIRFRCENTASAQAQFLTTNYIENESLKKTYEHNCLPLINKWVSEIKNLVRNIPSDNLPPYINNQIDEATHAKAGYIRNRGGNDGGGGGSSDLATGTWTCGNPDRPSLRRYALA